MRDLRSIIAALLICSSGLALAAAGCETAPPSQPIRLRPIPGTPQSADVLMFQVRLVLLQHRVRPDSPVEDVWRLLGTTNVPYEKRTLWEENDLRLGDGAHLAADRMNELVTETPDRTAHVKILTVRENMDFAIPLGGDRDCLDVLWTDASGQMAGRRFEKALAQLRLVCRSDPDSPDAVRIAIVPEVEYGPEEMHWVRTETGYKQQVGRASLVLSDLAAEVRLAPGRLLVLGGRRGADLSLGGTLFYERRGPDMWVQTLILTAERIRPGHVPEEGAIPFLTPAGQAPKPPAGPPAATQARPGESPKPPAGLPAAPPAGSPPGQTQPGQNPSSIRILPPAAPIPPRR